MNRTLLAFMLALCSVVSAQVEVVYPYNPDGNADSVISAPDLLDLLPIFGGTFTPEEITVNGEGLSTVLEEMQTVLDSLSSANGGADGQQHIQNVFIGVCRKGTATLDSNSPSGQ